MIPAQFRVIVTHRPKYACRACEEALVQAPAPDRLIKGGLPTEAMVAYVLVAKYAWHLPLYRQAQMLLAQEIDIKRAIAAIPIPASSPFQQSVNPRWRHPNCFRALPLGSAELLRFGEIFRRVAKLFLAGLRAALCRAACRHSRYLIAMRPDQK